MSLEITPEQAKSRIDDFIGQIEGLLQLSYDEGKDEKKQMERKLETFVETAFSDGEEKKSNLYISVGVISMGGGSRREKQRDYEESLKRKLRNLKAWKEQIELVETSQQEQQKVDQVEEEEKLEADRREKVAEQKYHGAVIELLDLQRDRIKEMEQTSKEISEIKTGIEDIKTLLQDLVERQGDGNE